MEDKLTAGAASSELNYFDEATILSISLSISVEELIVEIFEPSIDKKSPFLPAIKFTNFVSFFFHFLDYIKKKKKKEKISYLSKLVPCPLVHWNCFHL